MKNTAKRYTNYDRDFMRAAMKVGAQNGIPQEVIAEQLAPMLMRKPSAINSQMYILRSEWVSEVKTEMTLAYSKVKYDQEEITVNETEHVPFKPQGQEPIPEPIEKTPLLRPNLPVTGDEIEVVIVSIRNFGAIAKSEKYGITGLIHISNVTDEFIEHIEDWFVIGQRVNVVIVKQEEEGRYAFSSRHASNHNVYRLEKATV